MNTTTAITVNQALAGDLLEEVALSLEELARACRVPPDWVIERVESGFLDASTAPPGQWRFASASLCARGACATWKPRSKPAPRSLRWRPT